MSAGGQTLAVAARPGRHVRVPCRRAPRRRSLDVQFTVLVNSPGDRCRRANLAIVNWNRVLFYQADTNSHNVYFKPSIILPDGLELRHGASGSASSPGSGWTSPKCRSTCWWTRRSTWAATTSTSSCGARAAPTRCSTSSPTGRRTSTSPDKLIAEYKRLAPEALRALRLAALERLPLAADAVRSDRLPGHRAPSVERQSRPDDFMTNPKDQLAGR